MARFRQTQRQIAVEPIFGGGGLTVERMRWFDHTTLLPEEERWRQWSFRIMRGGTRYVSYGERTLILAPNTILWHGPLRAPVRLRALPGSSADQIVVSLSTGRWREWLVAQSVFGERHAAVIAQPPVLELGIAPPQVLLVIRDLLALHDSLHRSPHAIERQCALLLQLIGDVHFDQQPDNAAPERRQRVEAAQAILARDLRQPPDLVQLAKLLSVSPRQLQRDFLVCTNLTPRRYLNIMRLSEGNTLLADTSLPVVTIAARLGYVSQSHFSAAFRAVYGCSPREFRAALHRQIGHDEPQVSSSMYAEEESP